MKALIFKIIIFVVVGFVFIGCLEPLPEPPLKPIPGNMIDEALIYHDINKTSGLEIIRTPEFNIEKTVEVGENLYQKINQISFDTYRVDLLTNTEGSLFNGGWIRTDIQNDIIPSIRPAYRYSDPKHNEKIIHILYHWMNKNAMCMPAGSYSYDNKPISICLVDVEDSGYFSVATYSNKDKIYPLLNKAKYTLTKTPPVYNQESFKYEVLYQGKIENRIKISFREFKDNMLRPAFTQDIEYELNKNNTTIIGFKGLRIEVIKATNLDITYKIIQDYK